MLHVDRLELLRRFVKNLAWASGEWCSDIRGGDLQDALEEAGLIEEYTALAPCSNRCACVEVYGSDSFPHRCFRWADWMQGPDDD
jgi:hypothetical protein